MKINWVQALKIVGPTIIQAVKPEAVPYTNLIIKGIEVAEELKVLGQTKKERAIEIAGFAANVINTTTKKQVMSPEFAMEATDHTVDLIVAATNEFHRKQ